MLVLVADRAPGVRSALKLYIEQCRLDVHVLEAGSHAEVVAHATEVKIDVALVDWQLPKLGGKATLSHLRRLQPDACIIVLSGRPEAVREVREVDADAFISKADPPDSLKMLLERPDGCPDGASRTDGSGSTSSLRQRSPVARHPLRARLGPVPT